MIGSAVCHIRLKNEPHIVNTNPQIPVTRPEWSFNG
jgi:hypothetical protein